MTDVGMNLAPVLYYSTEFPFIDRMKSSGGWSIYGTPAPVDAHGNPTALPDGAPMISAIVPLDPPSAAPTDIYELTWSGTASFQLPMGRVISSQPGKIVFEFTGDANATMMNLIIRSISATDPVHDIHLVRQDEAAAFANGEIFTSQFLEQVSNWQTLRFMDWGATNSTTITSWDQRSHVEDATWAQTDTSPGVPIEIMIRLANEARTDMWFNIPTHADDTYVRNALQLIKEQLAPGLKVHVEYSNEVWNYGFAQSGYAQASANQLWGTDANHDGVINGADPAEAVYGGQQIYYGYRSAQIASIANSVFSGADDSRLEMVLATQTGNTTLEPYFLDGIARAHVGSVSSLFDELSGTSYFGFELGGATSADQAKVLGWAQSGDAGMQAAFNEMMHGGAGLSSKGSIDDLIPYLNHEVSFAAQYGMDFVGYEGGFHGSAIGYGANQSIVQDFIQRLLNDPRMQDVYKYWFDTFEAAGGKMLAAFNDVQKPNIFGSFGTLSSLYDAKTPRYEALLAEAAPKQAPSVPADPGATVTPATSPSDAVDSGSSTVHTSGIKAVVLNDFNGDGRSDILWRSGGGQLSNWLGQANGGFAANDGNALSNVSTAWHVAATGDFNGDGRADILWRHDNGQLSDWLGGSNGSFATNDANAFANVATNWHVAGAGDFNGDGRADILWRSDSGQLSNWLGRADGGFVTNDVNALSGAASAWKVAGIGDFNGDGRADILWRNDNGQMSNWLGQANGGFATNDANALASIPTTWHVAGVGDFNGDGRADILWRNDNGQLSDWLGQANGGFISNDVNAAHSVPMSWQVAATGDYNGDGRDDILWRNADGQLSDWLGQANGGFVVNDGNASAGVSLNWATQHGHPFLI